MSRTLILLTLAALLFACDCSAVAQPSRFELQTYDGHTITSTISRISKDGELVGASIDSMVVNDLLSMTHLDVENTPQRPVRVLLPRDGEIFVNEFTTDGQTANVISKTVDGGFPLESVRAVVWENSRKVELAIRNRSAEHDQVVVRKDDEEVIVSGLLERITQEKIELNYQGESRKISREIVLAFVTADLESRPPPGPACRVEMVDSGVVSGSIESMSEGLITVMLDQRNSISLDSRYVRHLSIESERISFLSELEPVESDQQIYFGVHRPWQRNQSVSGNQLRLSRESQSGTVQPQSFDRGIGTQSFSRLVFEGPEGFDRFQAVVGIDVETGGKGDCEMIVSADGVQVWQARVKGGQPAQSVDVDIEGIERLTLTVQPGHQLDLGDHANWCNARFVNTR